MSVKQRGQYFDARKLGFLEKFLQQDLSINFGSVRQTLFVQQAWDLIVKEVSARLLVQGGMRNLFPNATYSINSDSITIGDNLSTALNRLSTNIPTGSENAARYWSYAISILDNQSDLFNLTQLDYDNQIKTALSSSGLSAYLDALRNPVYGGAGNDLLSVAGGRASFLDGGAGDDTLAGTEQNDIINGGAGNDTIASRGGIDLIDGGAGLDSIEIDADYSSATTALTINDISPPPSTLPNGTQIRNVELQWFVRLSTGSGNDRITFSARQDNVINTGAGNDTINAGLGNDSVDGGTGNDLLILDYSKGDTDGGLFFGVGSSSGSAVRLSTSGGVALDSIIFYNIERFNITGTSKDDNIYTNTGNDTINSEAGNDTIDAGAGNDTVNAGEGDDTVNAGIGVDTVDGGAGTDKLILDLSTRTGNLSLVNYRSAGINLAGIAAATNFENFDIRTGSGDDTVTQVGDVNGVVIRGNDSISTGAGNDTINAGLGDNDQVDGGTGNDLLILDYSKGDTDGGLFFGVGSSSGSAVRFSTSGGVALDSTIFYNIERFNITGTSKDDNITTAAGNDTINAGGGNDTIDTGAGDDTVNAGAGDDTVNGGGGNDTLDGGVGIDKLTLDLSTQTTALNLTNYRSAGINITGVVNATNFENFDIRTGSSNDRVTQAGEVSGVVVRSNDSISTGAGNDTINAGLGDNDQVDGGTGNDLLILDYSKGDTDGGLSFSVGSGFGSAVRLSTSGGVALDSAIFYNIERFNITGTSKDDNIYTNTGNDTINSESGNDTIDAGAGNDTVNAGEGNDTVNAGIGVDTVDGGSGTDKLILDLSTQTTALNLTNYRSAGINITGVVTATNFENFDIRTGSGDDTVTQAEEVSGVVVRSNDSISTGAGNDTINAGLGDNDQVDGGTGNDLLILDYSKGDTDGGLSFGVGSSSGSAVRFSTSGGVALDSIIFYNIERFNITGTSKDDNIYSESGNDTIDTGAGNDTIDAGAGNDTVNAGAGNDTVNTGAGNDTVDAGGGNDTVDASGGNDTVDGGAGTDKLTLNLSAQTTDINIVNPISGINITGVVSAINFEVFDITTGSGNDTVTQAGLVNGTATRQSDTIKTGAGNDSINAGLGDYDVVDGGTGNDLLTINYSVGDTGTGMSFSSSNGGGGASRNISATDFNLLDFVYFYNIERFNITGTSKDDNITTAAGNDTINAGAGNDTVDAGGGNDTVRGSGGNDIINGGAGNDTLIGDTGNDRLTGGTGADRFTFNAPTEGNDRITDFNISQADLIVVSAAGFGGGLTAGASITADQLVLGTAAADASDRFIYDSATGALRFDVDGTGATAAVQIATLGNKPILSNTSITVIA